MLIVAGVVLAVNFRSVLLEYGVGISLPIAALALFVGLWAWSTRGSGSKPVSSGD
jgi:hypothetical protein